MMLEEQTGWVGTELAWDGGNLLEAKRRRREARQTIFTGLLERLSLGAALAQLSQTRFGYLDVRSFA